MNMTESEIIANDDQFERMKKKMVSYLQGCPESIELQSSPRRALVKKAFLRYGTNRLIDLEYYHYNAFEADLDMLIAEAETQQ